MTSIRKAKRRALRWDRYTTKIGVSGPRKDEGRVHPHTCCHAHSRWATVQLKHRRRYG